MTFSVCLISSRQNNFSAGKTSRNFRAFAYFSFSIINFSDCLAFGKNNFLFLYLQKDY